MEISNKTLAMFLVGAIVISLAGTIISLNKLNSMTGLVTSTGTAQVQVNTTSSITFAVAAVNFGSGYVNQSGSEKNCTLQTYTANSADCISFTANTAPLVIENDGNTLLAVNISSNVTATTFIGGDASAGGPQFMFNVTNNNTGACASPSITAWTAFTTAGTQICPSLNFTDGTDRMNIYLRLNIPYTAPSGTKQAQITATGV